ncbi:LOW QUALITY PROTEIN: probable cytochrome P450 4d21 [Drosophila eugracilis]|uniref:LOW QUALITY PROTEIN: probable cytochrome P450 4d21 n=1 Tax=Drosophila eugracilis TaxID=29029 RepID=UPI001BD9EE42|nr:LOW QUALITY PROTEIN: probable cytochrome P450 4d21 [Drosophila eugracilis]
MLLLLITGALVMLLVWDYGRRSLRLHFFERSKISGPVSIPILGNGLQALFFRPENYIQKFGDYFNKYGKTFRLWVLGECLVYTTDLKYFEAILSSGTLLKKAHLYRFLDDFLGDGILLSTGHKWTSRRKALAPAFHFKCLENFVEIMDRNSGIMVEKLKKVADGKTSVDLFKYVSLEALDVITETAMGIQVNAQSDPNCPYTKALKSVVYIESNRLASVSQRYDWLFPIAAPFVYRRLQRDIRLMQDFTDKVIRERRAILEQSKADGSYRPIIMGDEETGKKSKMALLDILLQATVDNKPLTNKDIREEVDVFIFAGDDTTTSGVSHALHVISRHPRVQKCIYEELVSVLGQDPDAPVTQAKLLELKYLDCVVKETMRLHPPVPILGRFLPKDLQVGDKVIPGNTSILLMPYYVYRDPEYFPDPLTFKPERWLNGKEASTVPFTYIPFSSGPKNCVGQKFANLQLKTLISKVIRHYELLPLGEDLKPTYTFILSSSSGNHVGLMPRKKVN